MPQIIFINITFIILTFLSKIYTIDKKDNVDWLKKGGEWCIYCDHAIAQTLCQDLYIQHRLSCLFRLKFYSVLNILINRLFLLCRFPSHPYDLTAKIILNILFGSSGLPPHPIFCIRLCPSPPCVPDEFSIGKFCFE